MTLSNDLIGTYIRRVSELRAAQDAHAHLTVDELQAIALDLGMTPADLALAQQQAEHHLTRGNGYLRYRCWDDAIDELEQAQGLIPLAVEPLYGLARAYQGRFQQWYQERDRRQAAVFAKQCLQLKPDYPAALALLSELDRPRLTRLRSPQPSFWAGLGGLLALSGLGLFWWSSHSAIAPSLSKSPLDPAQRLPMSQPVTATPSQEVKLPVILEPDAGVLGLQLEPRRSKLEHSSEGPVYELQGVLVNQSDRELQQLQLKAEFINGAGQTVATEMLEVLGIQDVALRSGDRLPISLSKPVHPGFSQVRLSVVTIDQPPPSSPDQTVIPVPVEWPTARPHSLQFRIGERRSQLKTDSAGRSYHDAVFEITNTSTVPIQKLRLQIDRYAMSGKLLDSQNLLVVYGNDPPLLPNETRIERDLTEIESDYARYKIQVLEID